jgi:hypothetical protein
LAAAITGEEREANPLDDRGKKKFSFQVKRAKGKFSLRGGKGKLQSR